VQYLWGIVSQMLFYATPVIYFTQSLDDATTIGRGLTAIATYGPTGAFITAFHNVLYDGRFPSAEVIVYLVVLAVTSFAVGNWIFSRLSPRFAEEM
jgi:ABC-type polysaccharide/polyol phosphate export permease